MAAKERADVNLLYKNIYLITKSIQTRRGYTKIKSYIPRYRILPKTN